MALWGEESPVETHVGQMRAPDTVYQREKLPYSSKSANFNRAKRSSNKVHLKMFFVFVQQNIKGSFICEDSFDL